MKISTRVKSIGLMILFILAFVGCGVDKTTGPKKELKTAMTMDIDSLSPYKIVSSGTEEILFNVYEGLVMPETDGSLRPTIASSYKVSEDGRVYTFKIRKNIKFHDGSILTPKDVVFSLNRMSGRDGSRAVKAILTEIKDIKIDGDDVIITLNKPNSAFIYALTIGIVPESNKDNLDKNPIGTGPFKIASYTREQSLNLEKFNDYWGDKAKLDRVTVFVIPNTQTAFLKLLSGEIDMLSRVDANRINELKDFKNIYAPQNTVQIFALNNKVSPFDDVRVRKAINYAIDKDAIINSVMAGKGIKLDTNMSPVMAKYAIPVTEQKQDLEKAKELLKEANVDNLMFTIKVPSNYAMHVNTAQIISEQLKKIGVTANIETVEWTTWLSDVYKGRKYEGTIVGLSGKLDPYAILRRYTTPYKSNFPNFSNEEYDRLVMEAKNSNDDELITNNYKKALEILRDKQAAIYIMDPELMTSMDKKLNGFVIYPTPYINFAKMSFGE